MTIQHTTKYTPVVRMNELKHFKIFGSDPAHSFEAGLVEILEHRMKCLQITDSRLCVRVMPFRRVGRHWLGVVVTPWSVKAVFAPGAREDWKPVKAGATRRVELPGGTFDFLGLRDNILGECLVLPLMGTMSIFVDQAAAEAFARACLEILMCPVAKPLPSCAMPNPVVSGETKGDRNDRK